MSTKQQLHTLIDKIEEKEYDFLLYFLLKFISETEALPDEIESFERGEKEIANGEFIAFEDFDWDS